MREKEEGLLRFARLACFADSLWGCTIFNDVITL
jgi:hypothetical protein